MTVETDLEALDAMTDEDIANAIAKDPDAYESTDEELASMRPASEVLPPALYERLLANQRNHRGPQKAPTKKQITARYDEDIIEYFKSGGRGWQTRMNDALREWVEQQS